MRSASSCTMSAGPKRLSNASNARWRWTPIAPTYGCISRPRRSTSWAAIAEAVSLLKRRILRNPETDASRALLAASYGQMGLIEEAREAWRELLRVNPDYSLEQRRKVLPYKNPDDFERFVEGLRKAGLPEE